MKDEDFFCFSCKETLKLKLGKVRLPHFSHLPNSLCQSFSEPESPEHLALKSVIQKWEKKVELEVYLPNLSQRPDGLLMNICLEIQCSSLSTDRLSERTRNYRANNYQVLWLLGCKFHLKNRLSPLQRGFLNYSANCGFYLWTLDLDTQELVLNYHILEDYLGKIYYKRKIFPFYKGDLQEILAYPQTNSMEETCEFSLQQTLKRFHQKNYLALQTRDKNMRNLQEKLYQKNLHILKMPKYYYYPGFKPLFAKSDFLLWKERLFALMEKGMSMKEGIYHLSQLDFSTHQLPNVRIKDCFFDFLLSEFLALKMLNCLIEKNGKFYLKKSLTKNLIPFDYSWQKIPKVSSRLPRKLC